MGGERNERDRTMYFGPGPAPLPTEVLEQVQAELLSYQSTGLSMMELSHRSLQFADIQERTETDLRRLLNLTDDYEVLFLQGGASLQFAMVPMNFLAEQGRASYVVTGAWAAKAADEARMFGDVHVAADTRAAARIPRADEIEVSEHDAYLHVTTNNTIIGSQWHQSLDRLTVPVVADMSSDICSRPLRMNCDLIYAGAQKNLGIAGVTLVLIKRTMLGRMVSARSIPNILNYETLAKAKSRYNTPPIFSIYVLHLMVQWMLRLGGLDKLAEVNERKANLLYKNIDDSDGFYRGHVEREGRSWMNVTFRLPSKDMEQQFLAAAKEAGFVGLSGHRSVGGVRVSLYNAVSHDACERLCAFMDKFRKDCRG